VKSIIYKQLIMTTIQISISSGALFTLQDLQLCLAFIKVFCH
jgi:hypothetical protein